MENQKKPDYRLLKIILGVVGGVVIICGVLALGLLYLSARPFFGPKVQIVLEPDDSVVSTVDPADLLAAARLLTERGRVLGPGSSFVVAENNQIIGRVPASYDIEAFVRGIAATGLLEIVDFGETPVPPGTIIATDLGSEDSAQPDAIRWHTVISNSGFASADASVDQSGQYQVSFTLTTSAAEQFAEYTTDNIGHYLGIVLDKVVIASPRVSSPITDGNGIVNGSFTQEEAKSLATYMEQGVLPVPLRVVDISRDSED